MRQGFEDHAAGKPARVQCAISITMADRYRGKGFSAQMVEAMKGIGAAHGLETLIAPVRPNLKNLYPLIPMTHYIQWRNAEDLPFDPWLRVHVRMGADLVKVCSRSMRIEGTIREWENWTSLRFPESASYIVPGALVPVEIDVEHDLGVYVEPNVWMIHRLGV